jgi:Tfp pilus assembly protein PilO
MMVAQSGPFQQLRSGWARLYQVLGLAGVVGIALSIAAAAVLLAAWPGYKRQLHTQSSVQAQALTPLPQSASLQPLSVTAMTLDLPAAAEIPSLLKQLKIAAVSNGLEWRSAEYRIVPSTQNQPAALEVRCTLKGPYPKLRGMLVQLKSLIRPFAIREFSATRANAETADVETKLAFAVFLRDEQVASPTRLTATP